jgi:N-acetylglucosamine malate deacetylase 1
VSVIAPLNLISEPNLSSETLLVGLAHPDDEVGMAGAILTQKARGDRVVIVWLSRGEMTEAFGPLSLSEVAARRTEQGARAGEILGVEARFLDFPDTRIEATRDAAIEVAKLLCEIRPTGLLTWGDAWVRGMRHPDHQAAGQIFRDAVLLARIAKLVSPHTPHRANIPVFTMRDVHSILPATAIDVTPHREKIEELASFYFRGVGFGDPEWMEARLSEIGSRWGARYAEEFDAWETEGGCLTASLLPAPPLAGGAHPTRQGTLK